MIKYLVILVLLVISCAEAQIKTGEHSNLGSVKTSIQLPNDNTIAQVSYILTCKSSIETQEDVGTWPVITDSTGQAKADGTIGGLDTDGVCTLSLSAQDSWGLTNGNIQNCSGSADGLQVGGSAVQINLICVDSVSSPKSGSITADVTVTTVQGTSYQCSGISRYISTEYSAPGYVYGLYLNMWVSVPSAPQIVTWSSNNPSATWYNNVTNELNPTITLSGNPETDPLTVANDPSLMIMTCNAQGTFNVTLTVQDTTTGLTVNSQPWTCPPDTSTFPVNCY
jgi:hypothetical protein